MSRRRIIIILQIFSGLLVGAAVLFGALAWRLSSSPVSLNFITPIIERNFSSSGKSYAVQIEDTVLIWDGWRHPADVRARNVKIFSGEGKILARLPQVSIGISALGLLKGELVVKSLGIRGLKASVTRYRDGGFGFGLTPADGGDQNIDDIVKRVAQELSRAPDQTDGVLGYLKAVSIIESQLLFDDKTAGTVWHAPRADIVMLRVKEGLRIDAAMGVRVNNTTTNVFTILNYRRTPGVFLAQLRFEGLNPSLLGRSIGGSNVLTNFDMPVTGEVALTASKDGTLQQLAGDITSPVGLIQAEFETASNGEHISGIARLDRINVAEIARRVPQLRDFEGVNLIFNGRIGGTGNRNGQIRALEANLASGAGTVDLPSVWKTPRSVKQIRIKAAAEEGFDRIDVSEALVDFGGPRIEAVAQVQRIGDESRLQVSADMFEMSFAALDEYWPKDLGKVARRWVIPNIRKGTARETNLRMIGWMPARNPDKLKISTVTGTMRYDGLEIDYWSPLPTVKNVRGTATFSSDRFDLVISTGDLRDIKVDQAHVNMYDLDTDEEQISIDVLMQGPLRSALEVLDHKPLEYVKKVGLNSNGISGRSAIRLRMDFPLDTKVTRDQLQVRSSASLKNVSMKPGPFGYDLIRGHLNFKLTDDAMSVVGRANLVGLDSRLEWRESFSDKSPYRTRYRLQTTLSGRDRDKFGIRGVDLIKGPLPVDATYSILPDDKRAVAAKFDLTGVTAKVSEFGIDKMPGQKAGAELELALDSKGAPLDGKVKFTGEVMQGTVDYIHAPDPNSAWRIALNQVSLQGNKVGGSVVRRNDGLYVADLTADTFDIVELMSKPGATPSQPRDYGFRVNAQVGVLKWGPRRSLSGVELSVWDDGSEIQSLRLNGGVGTGKSLGIAFEPTPAGYELLVDTDDFGAALQALDMAKSVVGGKLRIEGRRASLKAPMDGSVTVKDFKLKKAPAMARFLQVASLTGIVDALSQKGLDFELLEGRFAYDRGLLRLAEMRTFGSSIGITTEGTVDLNKEKAELGGTVIPAYTLNNVIRQIPLLGTILTGDEGMFAATYSLKGSIDNPEVSVNPLSALAPGFLRKIFGAFGGETGDPDAPRISQPPQKGSETGASGANSQP